MRATTSPGADHVAFLDQQLRQAAGEFGRDVDFVGLDAAVALDDADRQFGMVLLPPIGAGARRQNECDERSSHRGPAPAPALTIRYRNHGEEVRGAVARRHGTLARGIR